MLRYGVSVLLQFIGQIHIGSVYLTTDIEVYDVDVRQILVHNQTIIFYANILLIYIGHIGENSNARVIAQGVYLFDISYGILQCSFRRSDKLIYRYILTVSGRGKDMDYLIFVSGVAQPSADLRKQGGNIQQCISLASITDNERHSVFVVYIAPLKTGRGVEVDLLYGV